MKKRISATKMEKQILDRLHEELKQKYRNQDTRESFPKWFIEAAYGEPVLKKSLFSGRTGDGGIDAIVPNDGRVLVLQSKYSEARSALDTKELNRFRKLADLLCEGSDEDYKEWLETVTPELVQHYKDSLKPIRKQKGACADFVFVTTHKTGAADTARVKLHAISKTVALSRLWFDRKTPTIREIPITLQHEAEIEGDNGGYRTYVGLANARDFLLPKLSQLDWEMLFASNVRAELSSPINDAIKKSYETEDDLFWLLNNGLYVVCEEINKHKGRYYLHYPSVINGSQTLHAIRRSTKKHGCRVLVRILEMPSSGHDDMLENVIRSTNTQNLMDSYNLIAHREEQLAAARELLDLNLFYERRQNEWKKIYSHQQSFHGLTVVKSKEFAQWLAVSHKWVIGSARSQPATLILDKEYKKTFAGIRPRAKNKLDRDALVVLWAGLIVRHATRKIRKSLKPSFKKARLFITKVMYEALSGAGMSDAQVREAIKSRCFGVSRQVPTTPALIREFERLVKQSEKYCKDNTDSDVANLFKRDALTEALYGSLIDSALLADLRRHTIKMVALAQK